ncbi:hypothetical protein JD844_021361 [Phrynosoma platyrhinos]|uniref:Uncharacterized protein n=1 Tax=Phrynosoma platyrhinos TaxID=52577 RepID=A0ABQ7STM2_PHRPL|nr:hypothetical protein JD844_021361 [Phrynosoma platyrhinos]
MELDKFLDKDRSVFPKWISKSLHIARKPNGGTSQETASLPPQESQQDASVTAVVTVEEEGNIILQLVPVEQPLAVDPHPGEDMVLQDLLESPAASDETLITGEGPQEEATQSPGGETQDSGPNVGNDSPQEAAVRRVPVRSVVCQVRADEDIPDRRARRGELIARIIIEDSRREGQLNRALARHQHNSLLWTIGRDSDALESLAHSYHKDLAETAQYRQRMFGYMEQLINVALESVQEQQELRTALMSRELGCKTEAPGSLSGACNKKSKSQAGPHSTPVTGSQILFGDSGDEGPAACLVPCSEATQDDTQNCQPSETVPGKPKRLIKKKQLYCPS